MSPGLTPDQSGCRRDCGLPLTWPAGQDLDIMLRGSPGVWSGRYSSQATTTLYGIMATLRPLAIRTLNLTGHSRQRGPGIRGAPDSTPGEPLSCYPLFVRSFVKVRTDLGYRPWPWCGAHFGRLLLSASPCGLRGPHRPTLALCCALQLLTSGLSPWLSPGPLL